MALDGLVEQGHGGLTGQQHAAPVAGLGHQLQADGAERQHADPCPHRRLIGR